MDRQSARSSTSAVAMAASPTARRGSGWTSRTRLVEQVRQAQSRLGVSRRPRPTSVSRLTRIRGVTPRRRG